MKKLIGAAALSMLAGLSMAQTTVDNFGVTTSTDPAKIAAVQRHAAELQRNQGMSEKQPMATDSASPSKPSSHKAAHRHHGRRGHHRANSTPTSSK